MPDTIDFDCLLDAKTPPDHWRAEMEKSANLRAALEQIEQIRREAAEDGMPVDETDKCRQFLFHFTVQNTATAQRLHLGDTTIDMLIEDWQASVEDQFAIMMESGATGEDENPFDCPVCAPLEFDRERARAATADDGIDYGLLASSDATWWVWREEVNQTQHFKSVVEQLEPSMMVLEELDDHERYRIFMERVSELVSRDQDTIRALECGLLTSNDVLTEAMRRIIALHPQEELEELKKILQEQDS